MSSIENLTFLRGESRNEMSSPLTTIVLIPNSTPSPVSVIPSLKTTDEEELSPLSNEKRRSTGTILMVNVSRRLRRRKILHNRLCVTNDLMCFLGIFGVILMIIENEITFRSSYDQDTYVSWLIRLTISITTGILVILVFYYHRLDLSLYAVNNSLDHWRIGVTRTKIFVMFLEAFICIIHPIPRYFSFASDSSYDNSIITNSVPQSYIAMDVALGLPMFARVYLICRFVMFHSDMIRDASSQSLGSLNQVSLDFFFLIKTYLTQWPTRFLLVLCTFLFLIGSWSLRACNYKSTMEHLSILDSMWLVLVTFTTVGYGDLTPSTYCGRAVAAVTALMGVLSTALLISVLANKLQFTRSEKYVHNFVLSIGLAKERQIQAANVIKFAIKLWLVKRKHQPRSLEYIKVQRRLVRSMHFNQQLKYEQRKLVDSCVGLPEIITLQREASGQIQDHTERLTDLKSKVDQIEEKLVDVKETMSNIQSALNLLLNKLS